MSLNFFIIPGNPPALHFYELWAQEIKRDHPGASVCLSPYPLLDTGDYLNEMVAVHGQELVAFHKVVQKPVIILGHSLGGWMALKLLETHNDLIERCLLLYPFLKRPTLKGRAILQIAKYLRPDFLLSKRGLLERIIKDLKYVTDKELRSGLALTYHEQKVIGRNNAPLHIPKHFHQKLHLLYCEQDTWCPSSTVNELKQWISCEKAETSHGFITSPEERAKVLQTLSLLIKNNIY